MQPSALARPCPPRHALVECLSLLRGCARSNISPTPDVGSVVSGPCLYGPRPVAAMALVRWLRES